MPPGRPRAPAAPPAVSVPTVVQTAVLTVVLTVVVALAASGCSGRVRVADPPGGVVVAAGEPSGVYHRYGEGLAAALSADLPDTRVEVAATSGSVDNIELLAAGHAQLAFALADTAAEAVSGTGPFGGRPVELRAIARLYTNSVHVVVPRASGVQRVADLVGLRISVGAPGSGTELTATSMLRVAGLAAPGAVQVSRLGVGESADALREGRLDAFFWSGGLPTSGITGLVADTAVRLVPTDDLLAGLRADRGEYVAQTIPASVYGSAGDVSTIGVPNLLLVRADMPDDLAEALTTSLFAHRADLVTAHPEGRHLDEDSAIVTAPVPLHPGAAAYYRASKPGVG